MCKLSIITINYNNKNGLQKTIESVLSQSWKEFVYIIIDGGSTDGSKDLIIQHRDRINYWISEPDNGIYHAMNKGISVADGEYLLFLNSGDWLFSNNIIEKIYSHLNTSDIIYGDVMYINSEGKEWLHLSPTELSLYSLGYQWNSLPHQAMFIKKELFIKYGNYNEQFKIVADWAFYLKALFKYNASYKKINETITYYDFNGFSSKPENEPLQRKERKKVLATYFSNYDVLIKKQETLEAEVWKIEHSRIIKLLRKLRLLKF